MVPEEQLPVILPEIDEYKPTEAGDPPLARAANWKTSDGYTREYNTMPGFAGSSGYYLRYMDPHNDNEFISKDKNQYWENVDLYVGGSEHATGHLIYSRFWNKFLFDLGIVCKDEPYKKLINQGMIQGRTNFVYRINGTNKFVSLNLKDNYETTPIRVDVNIVHNDVLDTEAFKAWRPEYVDAEFVLEEDKYVCGWEVEKMSKSKYNVQNPDDLVEKYGADTLRLYEMFLGPIELSKPWDTNGIEGVFRFMKKFWKLYHDADNEFCVNDDEPTRDEYKSLHKAIKKVEEDNERFSFNTAVSTFMIAVNELTASYIFLLLGTYVVFFGDYTDSKERMLRQQKEMAEIKSELMLSQLNPHYIANTLNSIVALCRFDPPEAERATRLFARYLRENYVDMAGSQMIPFDRELQNLKNFISIEQIRFPHLEVEYAIDCTQFMIPVMTLQSLVENAITHGVHGNGRITISASETADDYVVCVADHGAGFTETPDDGRTHLGIRNCRERLQTLCGGSLNLSNPESGGAKCEIIIPKGGRR